MRYCKILILGLLFALIVIPLILADTEIHVKTLKNHRVNLIIREEGKLTTLDSFNQNTEDKEELVFTTKVSAEVLDLKIKLSEFREADNKFKVIINEDLNGIENENPIFINLIDADDVYALSGDEADNVLNGVVEEENDEKIIDNNETSGEDSVNIKDKISDNENADNNENPNNAPDVNVEEENTVNDKSNSPTGITGFAIRDVMPSGKISYVLFFIGVLAVVLVVVIYTRKRLNNRNEVFSVAPKKQSNDVNERIKKAEDKIREAQEELNRIKNREGAAERLKKAEEKFKRDQEELIRLRKEAS